MSHQDHVDRLPFKARKGLHVTGNALITGNLSVSGTVDFGSSSAPDLLLRSYIGATSGNWESTYTTVSGNSATWEKGGGGGAGAFITYLECPNITQIQYVQDEIAVTAGEGDGVPIESALVDDANVTLYVTWEGPATEWTGTPEISGHPIPRNQTQSIQNYAGRRFEGYITLNFDDYKGTTIDLPYVYQDITKTIQLEIAGGGPGITNMEVISTPPNMQDHYINGDDVEFVIEFDTTDFVSIQPYTNSVLRDQQLVPTSVNGISGTFVGQVHVPISSQSDITNYDIYVTAKNSLGTEGDVNTATDNIDAKGAPAIVNYNFNPSSLPKIYPGDQIEFGDNQPVTVRVEFDTSNVSKIRFVGTNDDTLASGNTSDITVNMLNSTKTGDVTFNTSFTSKGAPLSFERPVKARVNHLYGFGSTYGEFETSQSKIFVNAEKPQLTVNEPEYPAGQTGIKSGEIAIAKITAITTGNMPVYEYSSPTGEIEPADGNYNAYGTSKAVQIASGTYNVSTPNWKLKVTRTENGMSATASDIINIADVPPEITVTANSGTRMRSGGNDGTAPQTYNVRIQSNQRLKQAPLLMASVGDLSSFNWNPTATSFNATIEIHDDDPKGAANFSGLNVIGISGKTAHSITGSSEYILGGFVSRELPVLPGQDTTQMNVPWSDYSKLTISWSTNVPLTKFPPGTTSIETGGWAVITPDTAKSTINVPSQIRILDTSAAQAITVPSTLTIEETI